MSTLMKINITEKSSAPSSCCAPRNFLRPPLWSQYSITNFDLLFSRTSLRCVSDAEPCMDAGLVASLCLSGHKVKVVAKIVSVRVCNPDHITRALRYF